MTREGLTAEQVRVMGEMHRAGRAVDDIAAATGLDRKRVERLLFPPIKATSARAVTKRKWGRR